MVNHCSGKSIQKQIELQKGTIPAQIAKKGLSVFELLVTPMTVIPANFCEHMAATLPVPSVACIIQPAMVKKPSKSRSEMTA